MNVKLAGILLAVALPLAGCQSTGEGGYTETVQGDYLAIASCFAQQPIAGATEQRTGVMAGLSAGLNAEQNTSSTNGPRVQRPSLRQVTVNDAGSRTVVVEVGTATAGGYSVTFTGLTDTSTRVTAHTIGFPVRYFWPEQVAPLVARCSGRISS